MRLNDASPAQYRPPDPVPPAIAVVEPVGRGPGHRMEAVAWVTAITGLLLSPCVFGGALGLGGALLALLTAARHGSSGSRWAAIAVGLLAAAIGVTVAVLVLRAHRSACLGLCL